MSKEVIAVLRGHTISSYPQVSSYLHYLHHMNHQKLRQAVSTITICSSLSWVFFEGKGSKKKPGSNMQANSNLQTFNNISLGMTCVANNHFSFWLLLQFKMEKKKKSSKLCHTYSQLGKKLECLPLIILLVRLLEKETAHLKIKSILAKSKQFLQYLAHTSKQWTLLFCACNHMSLSQ